MNIAEFMSFDLEWFTTLPGLLITGGVIVLLIALIIFIISNKKADKKTEDEVVSQPVTQEGTLAPVNNEVPIEPQMPINEMAATVSVPVVPEVTNEPVNNMGYNEPIDVTYNSTGSVNILGNPQTNGVMPPVNTAVEIPTFFEQNVPTNINTMPVNNSVVNNPVDFSINNEPVAPITNNATVDTPVVTESVMPQVDNQIPTPVVQSEPINPQSQVQVLPQTTTQVVEQPAPQPTIYGGVNPINSVNTTPVVEDTKPVIYGGANPLENTTTIPRITNHEAYNVSGSVAYTSPSSPAQNVEPIITQVEQPTIQEVVAPVTPVVNENPVVQPMIYEMPKTGAEMFGTTEIDNNSGSNYSSNEIETLEF